MSSTITATKQKILWGYKVTDTNDKLCKFIHTVSEEMTVVVVAEEKKKKSDCYLSVCVAAGGRRGVMVPVSEDEVPV